MIVEVNERFTLQEKLRVILGLRFMKAVVEEVALRFHYFKNQVALVA